jgi:acetamidase/formamidase
MSHEVPNRGPHTLTGPIYVNGAEPGDVLKIHINKIIPRPYASNDIVPGKGLFPKEFPHSVVKYFYLDIKKMQMTFLPGITVPLSPFPGIIAVAPQTPGKYNSSPPGPFGGNMDLRELTQGTTLYLPVFQKGALLWTGDSHAGQGNGEIDLTAIETAFAELSLTVDVIKHKTLAWPRIETNSAWIAMGYDKDINKAFSITEEQTIKLIMEQRHVTQPIAEKIMLHTWNCPISEVVDGLQGVYCMIPRNKNATAFALPSQDTATEFVTVGKNADLMIAMKIASMAMIKKIAALKKMQPVDVYMLASMAMDCRIAPYHSGDKEVHCMMAKNLWV